VASVEKNFLSPHPLSYLSSAKKRSRKAAALMHGVESRHHAAGHSNATGGQTTRAVIPCSSLRSRPPACRLSERLGARQKDICGRSCISCVYLRILRQYFADLFCGNALSVVATGFADKGSRADHFTRHGADFGASSEAAYELLAIQFMNGGLSATIIEGVRRSNGDLIRFDRTTQAFAVMRSDGIIRTFFKADPAIHGLSSNLKYFQNECLK
jgi:hypothetical protein